MMNDRPVDDPKLQEALNQARHVFARYDLAGTCMLVGERESAFFYAMPASWSAFRDDPGSPLGYRIYANAQAEGKAATERRVLGAAHTVCHLADFGQQTLFWMGDVKKMLRDAGIEFEHTPFAGKRLEHLIGRRRS